MKTLIAVYCLLLTGFALAQPWSDVTLSQPTPVAAGGTPDFGAEIQRSSEVSSASTTVITTASGVSQGNTVILYLSWWNATMTLSSVADSRGNTYTIQTNLLYNTSENIAIVTAYCATALQTSDTITITWGSPDYSDRQWMVAYGTGINSSPLDQRASATAYNASVTCAASTTAANTLCVGILGIENQTATYGSGNWTTIGAVHDNASSGKRRYYLQSARSSAASQDPAGTISAARTYGVAWVALK